MRLTLFALLLVGSGLQAQVTVVNCASFRPEQPIAAGTCAAAFGTFTGAASGSFSGTYPLPKALLGVSVTIDGVDAPLYFVSAGQINFQVPFQVAAGVRPVQVKTPGTTVSGTVRIISAAPGLFVQDTATPPKGAITNSDNSVNTATNVARRGQTIIIYGTGPGPITPALVEGAAAPASPLSKTVSTPQVFIGGLATEVSFSGMTPTIAGLWQINAVVPDKPFITGKVPVVVYMDGVDSNEVTVFVQ